MIYCYELVATYYINRSIEDLILIRLIYLQTELLVLCIYLVNTMNILKEEDNSRLCLQSIKSFNLYTVAYSMGVHQDFALNSLGASRWLPDPMPCLLSIQSFNQYTVADSRGEGAPGLALDPLGASRRSTDPMPKIGTHPPPQLQILDPPLV